MELIAVERGALGRRLLLETAALKNLYFTGWPYAQANNMRRHAAQIEHEMGLPGAVLLTVRDGSGELVAATLGHDSPPEGFEEPADHQYRSWVAVAPELQGTGVLTAYIDLMWNDAVTRGYKGTKFLVIDAEKDGHHPLDYFHQQGYRVLPGFLDYGEAGRYFKVYRTVGEES